MNLFDDISNYRLTSYNVFIPNFQKVLAEWVGLVNLVGIKDCSGGNNSPSQHSLRRAVSFWGRLGAG
jgi:hypothetical protein